MHTRYLRAVIGVFMVLISLCLFTSCGTWIVAYPDICDSYDYSPDDSIPLVDIAHAPTSNMSRGLRGEIYINLGMDEAYPGSHNDYMTELDREIEYYREDDMHLVQLYVYIGKYYDTDIPSEALVELRTFLEEIERRDLKVLLRFAYETGSSTDGPRTRDIERHAHTLKTFFTENITLVHRTIYAVQLGMIGLWGEGHGAHHHIDVRRVAIAVADMVPSDIPLMVRTPEMLREVPDEIESRFGVHDDFLVGYDHDWGMMHYDDPNYPLLMAKCKYTVTDAEMPWGKAGERVDVMGLLRQCVGYGLTSLSLKHNYREDGGTYLLEQWKSEYLTQETLCREHFPYNAALLIDGKISVYDYLKHHLGYQLVASNLRIEGGKASFMLTNYGFALPYGYDMEIYVDGESVTLDSAYSERDMVQFGQRIYSFDYAGGDIAVMMRNRRDNADMIRLFNDIPYDNGMNIIHR